MKSIVLVLMLIAGRAAASDNSDLREMAASVYHASKIEAWRLSCRDTTGPVIWLSAERVVAQVADLDSISRNQLFFIIEGAARDTSDCVDYKCSYCPGYRLVIHDANPPMIMTIGEGCISWTFKRDGKQLRKPGGCGYVPSSFTGPLTKWITGIFGPSR